ncbi:hypothetical protein [Micromonospora sp. RL09-050-HVF-A]|uniref:hypothetical protein n=1 Tax=Micromonospora sp. RL09-050-HVF-A TaxID=1703433 RepID=UPI0035ABB4EA
MTAVPRLVFSAPSSGHGTNALSVGLLAALADRGSTSPVSRSARTTWTPRTSAWRPAVPVATSIPG